MGEREGVGGNDNQDRGLVTIQGAAGTMTVCNLCAEPLLVAQLEVR